MISFYLIIFIIFTLCDINIYASHIYRQLIERKKIILLLINACDKLENIFYLLVCLELLTHFSLFSHKPSISM